MLLNSQQSCLVLIDIQENLCPVMDESRRVLDNSIRLARSAAFLSVPILATEQYPKGLGPTMVDLRKYLLPEAISAKTVFSCARDELFMAKLQACCRPQVVLAGIEFHVCVLQTAMELKALGFEVAVVEDACSSRHSADSAAAMLRLARNGCEIVTTEMVLFEWLGDSRHPSFKEIQKQVIQEAKGKKDD